VNKAHQSWKLVNMRIRNRSADASVNPISQKKIPMIDYQFGSWRVAISQQLRTKENLASTPYWAHRSGGLEHMTESAAVTENQGVGS
jgi:hypothetical protein